MRGPGRALLVLVVAACGAALAGCGPSSEEKTTGNDLEAGVERDPALDVLRTANPNADTLVFSVDCPDIEVERGSELTCKVTGSLPSPVTGLPSGEGELAKGRARVAIGMDGGIRVTKVTPVD